MKRSLFLLIIFIILISCSTVPAGDTSRNSLDWPGTYKCDQMTITLNKNNTYIAQIGDVEVRSSFCWDRREQSICLDNLVSKAPCRKFKVGENALIPLKMCGLPQKDKSPLKKVSNNGKR